jgi:hypothetical protein
MWLSDMATDRNFSMSGINSGHHNLPTYEMALKSDNVEFVRYCGGHFENGDARNFSMSGINSKLILRKYSLEVFHYHACWVVDAYNINSAIVQLHYDCKTLR